MTTMTSTRIVASATPEQLSPATSAFVHHGLGIEGSAHDINAECSGWIYGLIFGAAMIKIDPRKVEARKDGYECRGAAHELVTCSNLWHSLTVY